MAETKVDWLLNMEPRAAQIEAVRRSYYGEALWDQNPEKWPEAVPNLRKLHNGPRKGWGHFLQMRLGKTPTFLNELMLYRRDYDFKWGVVFTPPKFKLDWPLEAERFGLNLPSFAFNSTKCDEAAAFIRKNPNGGLLAVNYEATRYEKNLAIIESVVNDRCFLGTDESVNIKNPQSMYTKAISAFSKDAGALRLMSGKPVVHGPQDYYSQLRFIGELDGMNQWSFRNTFCKMGGFQGKQVKGTKNEERLYAIIDKCSWAPRRVDWMQTFGIDYVERAIALPDAQMKLYHTMQEDFLVELQDGTVVSADIIVGKLLKMQQISSGFLYDEQGKTHFLVAHDKNVKALEAKAILENELPDNEKMLIFTYFAPSIDILFETLKDFNPRGIRPGMTDEQIIEQKFQFNNDPTCRVFIANSKAVKYGHTLMGTPECPCTAEVFYENHYSLDDRAQCEERSQGAGQVGNLTVFDFICTKHDRAPVRALQRKEDISAAMMRYDRTTGLLPPPPTPRAS